MKKSEDLLTAWTKAQQKLWESLASALASSRSAEGEELVKAAHRGGLSAWEAAVNQSLKAQETWLEQWFRNAEMANPEMGDAAEQLQEIMQSWLSTQSQLWENWFSLLKTYSQTAQDGAKQAADLAERLPMPPPPPVAQGKPAPVKKVPDEPATQPDPSPPPTVVDDLKMIKGIGPKLEEKLNALGIHSFRQIAQIGATEVERIESVLRFPGRMYRDNWVGQAREAHRQKYGEELS